MTMEFEIDGRIHNRIIGPRGKSVRKLMDEFKVDIRFPKGEHNKCVVSGLEENCESCKEHLLMLEEEYVSVTFKSINADNWPLSRIFAL